MTVGLAGTGIMGAGIARNLVRKSHQVMVWNRTRAKAEQIEGAVVAESPAELARACDPVMICVSDTPDVEQVVLGNDGILRGLGPGKLVVDHSTISPQATRGLASMVAAKGADWIDAPVTGGSEGAERGTLSVMVGGDTAGLVKARPFMEAYAVAITHMGPVGTGQLAKIVNQILVVGAQLAASEALLFAQGAGLDLETTIDAVKGGAGGSWMLSNRGPQMIRRDWRPGFTIDLQQKDLRIALEAAAGLGVPLPGTALIHQLYRGLQRRGLGGEGNHALVKALEELAGIRLGDPSVR